MKTVLVGVTGCVAIYKTCEIIRGFQKAGLRAKVVMTESATHFINPTLFRALTREPVAVGLFDDRPGDPIHHISLSKKPTCSSSRRARLTSSRNWRTELPTTF